MHFRKRIGQRLKLRPFDGVDLMPSLMGEVKSQKRTLFWRRVTPKFVTTHRAVRDGDWKLMDEPKGRQSLYDLSQDIAEANNRAAQEPEQVARLKKLLDWWESDVSPPLYPLKPQAAAVEESPAEAP